MKHRIFDSKRNKIIILVIGIALMSIGVIALVFTLSRLIDNETNGQVLAGTVGAVASLIGSLIIVFQLKGESSLNCAQMLSDLNFSFIENERLMLVYRELQKAYNDPNYEMIFDNDDPNKLHDEDLMAYITFYETLNEYYHHGVLTIGQMNDLFGDRFFKLIHNKTVQERELFSEPSSYVNIFELYGSWINYRQKCEKNGESRISVRKDLVIPYVYVEKKTYMKEVTRLNFKDEDLTFKNKNNKEITLHYRRLWPKDIKACLTLQNEIMAKLENEELFVPSTKDEFFESFLVDYCYGLFDNDKLVALGLVVLNRTDERNLAKDANKNYCECITFDSIQVKEEYRGYGIHSFFLKETDKIAKICNAKYILATVSPKNNFSKNNFLNDNYKVNKTMTKYNNLERDVMEKEVK